MQQFCPFFYYYLRWDWSLKKKERATVCANNHKNS